MSPRVRVCLFAVAIAGFAAFYLWGLHGLPGFGNYPGPYGFIINRLAVAQTNATGIVSAVNFEYRGFDTVGEEFILFIAATGVSTVLRQLRGEREHSPVDEGMGRSGVMTSDAIRISALAFVGPVALFGWELASHAQTNPSGGFQGGVVLASAVMLVYLAGQLLTFKRFSPADVTDAVEAVGAGGFVVVGLAAVFIGLPYLYNWLGLGGSPGAVTSSGTIALISFFVGIEVTAAFVLIVSELLEQTLMTQEGKG